MKKLFLLFFLLIPVPVFAYNITSDLFIAQSYSNNTWVSNSTAQSTVLNASRYVINNTNNTTQLRFIYNQNNPVDLTTTGYTNYDLAVFNVKIFNNQLSAGMGQILSVSVFGNECYFNQQIDEYDYPEESLQLSAYCSGDIPNTWGYTANIVTINFASSVISYVNISDITLIATNGKIFNSLNEIKQYLQNNGNTSIVNAINNQTQQQQQQNQIINNTDTSSNSNDFASTINNFSMPNDSHAFDILGGLQNFIGGLSVSSSCRRLTIPIPFTNQNLTLPCMTTDVYSVHFPQIVVIWQLIVRGLVYYYIIVNILRLIKETIDPFNFKLEVMDL